MATKGRSVRGTMAAVYRIEIAGPSEPPALEALELDLRQLARRFGAAIEEFRVDP